MSIRLRLLLSYTAMLAVTITLFVAAVLLIALAVTGDVKSVRDFYTSHYAHKPVTEQEESTFIDIKFLSKKHPQQLRDVQQLKSFDKNLAPVNAGLIVRRENVLLYSSPILHDPAIAAALPPFEFANINVRDTMNVGNRYYTYVKFDFYFEDQSKGSVYVIKEVSPYAELARNSFPILIGALLILLVLTNGVVNYFVSRSIVRPLSALKKATEQIRDGNLNFQVATSAKDEIGQLFVAFEDMRQKLKESIELQLQYEENRKELISNISHDLKTPITAIKGYVEGIRDGVADTPEKLEKYLSTISGKASDLDRLIDELFLFSKLDLKRLPFSFEHVDIHSYLEDCMEELRFDLEEKGISISFQPGSPEPTRVVADREKLKRTISNIIGNCVKYMNGEEKRIEIFTTAAPDQVTVEIRDNGPGIEPSAVPHIFERFYRAEHSRNISTGGSGLGLAIAKQIILEHGGNIWATSELGKGTSIFFTLKRQVSKSGERN